MENDLVAQLVHAVSERECAWHQGWNDGKDGHPEASKTVLLLATKIRDKLTRLNGKIKILEAGLLQYAKEEFWE